MKRSFGTAPGRLFLPALLLMAAGTVFVTLDE